MKRPSDEALAQLIAVALVLLIVGAAVGFQAGLAAWRCSSRWSGSGLVSRWKLSGGCRVEVRPGVWMPEASVRSLP